MARAKNIGTMYAELSVKDKMTAGLAKARKALNNFADDAAHAAKNGAVAIAATAGAAVAYQMGRSIKDASDLGETISKTGQVFKSNADDIAFWASKTATGFGIAKGEAMAAAASFGSMFSVMGMDTGKSAEMSKTLVELASDLASFHNASSEEAITALGAALRGEMEPIRRFGVMLDDATLRAEAFAMGIYNGKGSLEPTTKALASYSAILKQTAIAQGDYERTQDGLANTMRTINALYKDASAEIGTALLPETEKLAKEFRGFLMDTDFRDITAGIVTLGQKLKSLGDTIVWLKDMSLPFMIGDKIAEMLIGSEADPQKAKELMEQWQKDDPNFMKSGADRSASSGPGFTDKPSYVAPILTKEQIKDAEKLAGKQAEVAKSKAEAMREYNLESQMITAQLKGDKEKLKMLEREKKIREEMATLIAAGFTADEARNPAIAKVDALQKIADMESKAKAGFDFQASNFELGQGPRAGMSLNADGGASMAKRSIDYLAKIADILGTAKMEDKILIWR